MRRVAIVLVLAAAFALPSTARATTIGVGQVLQIHSLGSNTGAGPFLADLPGNMPDFITFCLELTAPLAYDVDLVVVNISGSTQGPDAPHAISSRSAFWYWRYLEGDTNYPGSYVQWAIWAEEGYLQWSAIPSGAKLMADNTTNALMISYGWNPNSLNWVEVLTLEYDGLPQQDILHANPEPGSMILLGSGLSAAAWRLRRRRQSK